MTLVILVGDLGRGVVLGSDHVDLVTLLGERVVKVVAVAALHAERDRITQWEDVERAVGHADRPRLALVLARARGAALAAAAGRARSAARAARASARRGAGAAGRAGAAGCARGAALSAARRARRARSAARSGYRSRSTRLRDGACAPAARRVEPTVTLEPLLGERLVELRLAGEEAAGDGEKAEPPQNACTITHGVIGRPGNRVLECRCLEMTLC